MSAPGAPPTPEGWQTSWNAQYNQWFYFHPATGVSQWEYPSVPQAPVPPPAYPPEVAPAQRQQQQQSGGFFGKITNFATHNPAQTALAVGGSLAAGAFLEHEASEFVHHHHIHGPGLGTMAGLLGAAGAGALGTKLLSGKTQAQAPQAPVPQPQYQQPQYQQPQYPQAQYPGTPSVGPPTGAYPGSPQIVPTTPGYGTPGTVGSPGPAGSPMPGQPPSTHSGPGLGTLAAVGAGVGIAGAFAATEASHLMHHNRPNAGGPARTDSQPSLGAGIMNKFHNSNKPRLTIHAATFAGEDVTQKMQLLVKDDQSISISGEKMIENFGDPWPDSGWCREVCVLYQYGDRPLEVYCGLSTWDAFQIFHESLVTERMKFVNPPPSPIISLIWGTVNILNEERAEKLARDGELEAKDLGECGHGIGTGWREAWPVLVCFYRTQHGRVGIAHARHGGTLRLPWNPLAKWG